MSKITFLGAGSTIFAKNILGDIILFPALCDSEIALYDIDSQRLSESKMMLENINANLCKSKAKIRSYLGIKNRRKALRGANYVINAVQIGGYEPSTVIDFEIPKKYGLRQTIGDTLGIAGSFRALRTIPVLLDFAKDMEAVCPDAWFLNYSNPMCMLTSAMLNATSVKTVGLCHSVQHCVPGLFKTLGIEKSCDDLKWTIAGINHMAWLLELSHKGKDLYPEIRAKAEKLNKQVRKRGVAKHDNMVRLELMRHFGYYVTESSEHNAEYTPYWIKSTHPELIEEFNIPLDEYPRRCIKQIEDWKKQKNDVVENKNLTHKQSIEFGSQIVLAIETGKPCRVHGNVLNNGLISNLPNDSVVEVPCLVDRNGVQGCYVGKLPTQCAALNMTNINVQQMTVEAALTRKKDAIYQAAMLDPHTASELTLDAIRSLCDDLIKAHGSYLPKYK